MLLGHDRLGFSRAERVPRLRRALTKDARADSCRRVCFARLIGGGLGFGWIDFDATLEMGAVLDADARRGNIADD